jgi:hypothetical protein
MVAVAVAAPFLMLLRDVEAGEILIGLSMVVGCVVILAHKLTSDAIVRNEADGKRLGRGRKLGIALVSSTIALALIGTVDLAFFVTYDLHVYYLGRLRSHHSFHLYIQYLGLVKGAVVALGVAICWRFALRRLKVLKP